MRYRYVATFGFTVTWPRAEFDATAALRRCQGAHVIVSSEDSDLSLYVVGDTTNGGAILYPAKKSRLRLMDTKHKIANLCKKFGADEQDVRTYFK